MLLLPATPEIIAGFIAAAQAAPEERRDLEEVEAGWTTSGS
jgi:hypothetical protein